MKMLRQLPKLLRFIPGTAQDVRAYFLTLQYWLAGSDENIANMVRLLVDRYADGAAPRPARHAEGRSRRSNIPMSASIIRACAGPHRRARRQRCRADRGRARAPSALLLLRSYVLAGNAGHYDGVIAALEARGLRVIPAFASGLDQRPAIERFFMQRRPHRRRRAWCRSPASRWSAAPPTTTPRPPRTCWRSSTCRISSAHPVEFQTLEQWGADARGLLPVEATMMVAIPELDGATGPMVFGGRSMRGIACTGCERLHVRRPRSARHACLQRARRHAGRAGRAAGRAAPHATRRDRKVAIVLFNFPPNAGTTGTAAYLVGLRVAASTR